MMNSEGSPTTFAMILALLIVMFASTLSALSGVGKGIKWLSNINMGLSFFLLAFFIMFGSTMFALSSLFVGLWDYIINLPAMSLTVWRPDGNPETIESQLAGWQGGLDDLLLGMVDCLRTLRRSVLGADFARQVIS